MADCARSTNLWQRRRYQSIIVLQQLKINWQRFITVNPNTLLKASTLKPFSFVSLDRTMFVNLLFTTPSTSLARGAYAWQTRCCLGTHQPCGTTGSS